MNKKAVMIKIKSQIWEITFATSDMKWLLCLIHMSLYKLIRKNNNTPNKKDGQRKWTTNPSIPKKEEKLEEESRHNDQILQDKPRGGRMPESPAPV